MPEFTMPLFGETGGLHSVHSGKALEADLTHMKLIYPFQRSALPRQRTEVNWRRGDVETYTSEKLIKSENSSLANPRSLEM